MHPLHHLALALPLLSAAAALPHPIPTFPADILLPPTIPILAPDASLPTHILTHHHPRALRPIMVTPHVSKHIWWRRHPPTALSTPTSFAFQTHTTPSPRPTPTAMAPLSVEGAGSGEREGEAEGEAEGESDTQRVPRAEAKNIYPGPRYTGGPKCMKREEGMLVPCDIGVQSRRLHHTPTLRQSTHTV